MDTSFILKSKPPPPIWQYRMAIVWAGLFSVNALCTSIGMALVGKDWATMKQQERVLVCILIVGNWTGMLMAFMSQHAKKLPQGESSFPSSDKENKEP